MSTRRCSSRNWNLIFSISAPVSVLASTPQESWLPAATTMWEEPPASRRCSSPAKAESPSLFPSLRLPWFFTHEEEKMTITSRQSFNVLTVIFLLLSTAGLYNLGWLLQWLLTGREPEHDQTHVKSISSTDYALKWDYCMRTMTWIQERRPKIHKFMDGSWHLHGQKLSQIHSMSREQGTVFPGP